MANKSIIFNIFIRKRIYLQKVYKKVFVVAVKVSKNDFCAECTNVEKTVKYKCKLHKKS